MLTTKFSLFIDESGEAGIHKIRSEATKGASPYMVLGAALVATEQKCEFEGLLHEISKAIGKKNLHCSNLNHYQILYFAREI
ncbi:MAG: DUF3800 domain-containing protein [Alteraurantiacibacter sp.]|nr:DUF3800 domain-containing protein [Alteraurantiacibacter sp.]